MEKVGTRLGRQVGFGIQHSLVWYCRKCPARNCIFRPRGDVTKQSYKYYTLRAFGRSSTLLSSLNSLYYQ